MAGAVGVVGSARVTDVQLTHDLRQWPTAEHKSQTLAFSCGIAA